jgi:hypothetical protein
MATTTNFGWETPDDSDLVKDGALAMRTLGNSIDTSFVDLKGGTTGQILSKASNTDLDYTWINNDQGDLTAITAGTGISVTDGTGPIPTVAIDSTVATLTGSQTLTNKTISATANTLTGVINNTLTTTTGDIIYASSANTPARLAIGSTNQVLTVSGGVPTWATPATVTFPAFSATPNATLTPSQSTDTKVLFQTETFDSDNTFASSTFTPNKAGYYQINANLLCNNNGRVILYLYKNGSVYTRLVDHNSATNVTAQGSCLVSMNGTTDYLELYIYMTGTTRSVDSGITVSQFNGVGIRSN